MSFIRSLQKYSTCIDATNTIFKGSTLFLFSFTRYPLQTFFPGLRNTLSPLETFWEKNKKCIISSVWPQSKRPFESIFLTEQKLKLSLGRMHTMNGQLKSAPFRMSMMDFNKIPDRRHVNDFKLQRAVQAVLFTHQKLKTAFD